MQITNDMPRIYVHDLLDRIEELSETTLENLAPDEMEELLKLLALSKELNDDAITNAVTLIQESEFVEYVKDLIDDVCPDILPEEQASNWPYRHLTMDYKAAADELKADYMDVDFDGVTYYYESY